MNNFVIDTPDNFWQIRWLDKYMEGHKGFIAGGCFKNILSGRSMISYNCLTMIAVKNPEVEHITNVNVMRCLTLTDAAIRNAL